MLTRSLFMGVGALVLWGCDAATDRSYGNVADLQNLNGRYSLSGNCGVADEVLSIDETFVQIADTVCQISDRAADGDITRLDLVSCVSASGEKPSLSVEFFMESETDLLVFLPDGESQYSRCAG